MLCFGDNRFMEVYILGFYLFSNMLLAVALGMLAMKLRFSTIPKASLFFAGAAVTPFIYGSLTLLLLCVPVQLPALVYTILPVALASVVLIANYRQFREIPRIIRSIPTPQKAAALASVILFPLLSISPGIALVIQYKLSPSHIVLLSIACAMLLTLLCAPFCKQIWVPLKHSKRMALLSIAVVLLTASIGSAFLVDYSSSRHINFFCVLICTAVVILLALALASLLRRFFGFSGYRSKKVAAYYSVLSTALVFLRFGARQCTLVFSNANQTIASIAVFLVLIVFYICLALFIAERIIRKTCADTVVGMDSPAPFYQLLRKIVRYVVIAFSIVSLLTALATIATVAPAAIVGSDAMEYMTSAYEIANERTFASVNSFNGSVDGSQIGVVHHPAWIAYLAQALMHSPTQSFGYPNDFAARAAFSLTYVYLFVAVYALARAFLPRRYSLLAVALSACTPKLGNLIARNSREGFRIIPILILILVLYGYASMVSQKRRTYWPGLITVFVVASFTMMGHVINAIPAAAIGLSIIVFLLISRNVNWNTIWMCVSAALGGLFGCIQILIGYIEHGKLLSDIISLDVILNDTPYLDNFKTYQLSRLGDTQTYLDRINVIIRYDHGVMILAGLLAGISFFVMFVSATRKRKTAGIAGLLGLVGIFFATLFTDFFSWSGYTLTEWSIMNIRYISHLYFVYSILAVGGLYLLENVKVKRTFFSIAASTLIACYAVFPNAQIGRTYSFENQVESNISYVESYVAAYKDHEDSAGRILIDNYYCNYYLNCEAMTIFSNAANDIRHAQTLEELRDALESKDIDAILLTDQFISLYWEDTILLELVSSSDYQMTDYGLFQVYQKVV